MSISNSELADTLAIEDRDLEGAVARAERRERFAVLGMRIAFIVAVLALWEVSVRVGWAQELLIGQPSRIARFLAETLVGGELLQHAMITGMEAITGYGLGVILGTSTGFLMWWLPRLGRTVDPYFIAVSAIPTVALAPLFLVWLGLGIATKVALGFKTVFLVMHLTTYASLRQTPAELVDLATALGATRFQIFRKVVVPSSLPWVLSAMKVSIGFALTGTVVGEYVAANKGLGYLTLYAAQLYEMSLVWAAIIVLVCMSLVMLSIVSALRTRFASWNDQA
jgi:NitT/TauT family transport system permease protein